MTKKLLFICLFILGIFTTACGGGGKSTITSDNSAFYYLLAQQNANNEQQPAQYQLELSQTEFTVNVGETDNINVTLNGQDITQTSTYNVDQEAIASVEGGLITGLSVGVAIVTVHAENAIEDKTFTVNVIDPNLPTLEVEPTEINLGIDDTSNVKVTLEGEEVTEKVTYKSDNESIATAEKGIVKAKYTEGTANIAVSLEGANSAIFKVNVTDNSKAIKLDKNILPILDYERVYNKSNYKYDIKKLADGEIVKNLEIPATFTCSGTKYKITSIASSTFSNCSLESVVIPDTVTSIEPNAFNNCSSLQEIHIGEGVLCIFPSAFMGCDSLTQLTTKSKKIDIPDNFLIDNDNNLTFIYVKQQSSKVEGDIEIPDGVTEIPNNAFNYSKLESIKIPDTVVSIGYSAFYYCSKLESITLPDSVTSIGSEAFCNCSSLQEIHIGDGVLCIFPLAFMYCNNLTQLTTKSKKIDIPDGFSIDNDNNVTFIYVKQVSSDLEGDIEIPEGVTEIPYRAFWNSKLTNITIPDSVISIGTRAFYNCSLTSITIPDSVTIIGEDAFCDCYNLESVTFGENSSLMTIGTSAFYNCSLTSITIPDSITSIGEQAFCDCYNLESVTFGENSSLKTIGTRAFYKCSSLEKVTIPDSVTSIGIEAFYKCSSLESVTFGENSSLKTIGGSAFDSCSSLKSITIPDSVTTIGTSAFYNCYKLESVTFGENSSLTTIGQMAFYNCYKLENVTFGENSNLTTIGRVAFYNCGYYNETPEIQGSTQTAHLTLTIPSKVTSIGEQAFYRVDNINISEAQKELEGYSSKWGALHVNGE